jgi:hypothetical protein
MNTTAISPIPDPVLDTSRGRRQGAIRTALRAGGGGQDTIGNCWAKVHPISRYNWKCGRKTAD